MRASGRDEARVGRAARRGVDHPGAEVARAARGRRVGRDEPGKANRAEVDARAGGARAELPGVEREVAADVLAVELVAAVHRDGHVPLLLAHAADGALLLERGQPVDGDRAREDEAHRTPEARRLVLRHAKDVERPLHVDLVRELRVTLASRRQERGEVEHHVHLVVRGDLVEQVPVHDVARVARDDERAQPIRWQGEIEGDDVEPPVAPPPSAGEIDRSRRWHP